jgi:Polyketide cyclase / dehydrase and lipid transport
MLPAADEAFLASAPSRFVDTIEVALPADTVWAELTRDGALDWCRGLEITWLSPRPFGVGTKRQAKLLGVLLRVQEEYFIWEEGHRMAFFVTAVRPPAYRRSAEDYLVEALGPDRCRFTWTLAFDLTLLGKLNSPLSAPIIKRMFADTRRHLERLAARR